MCMMVYLGSDEPLELISPDGDEPHICVENLNKRQTKVRRHFSKPYVYYVGSHTYCGCGFQRLGFEPEDESLKEEERLAIESRKQLRALIERLLRTQTDVELFAVWTGEEKRRPKVSHELPPEALTDTHTEFCQKGEFIRFSRST